MSTRKASGAQIFAVLFCSLWVLAGNAEAQDDLLTLCGEGTGGLPTAWAREDGKIHYTDGNVGIGTDNPTHELTVDGTVNATKFLRDGVDLDSHYVNIDENNSISSNMIVNGTVKDQDVDSGDIQLRVSESCPAGSSIRKIREDGTVVCNAAGSGIEISEEYTCIKTPNDYGDEKTCSLGVHKMCFLTGIGTSDASNWDAHFPGTCKIDGTPGGEFTLFVRRVQPSNQLPCHARCLNW